MKLYRKTKKNLTTKAGKVPEYKTLQDDTPVAKLTLATTETFRLEIGETQTRTEWHTIIAWRGVATLVNDFVRKGSLIYVEGKLHNRNFEDAAGQKKYITEVVADQVLLLDKKSKERVEESKEDEDMEDRPLPF